VEEIRRITNGRGADVALELIGLPKTMGQAVESLGVMGRAVMVGISDQPLSIDTYRQVLGREAEVIGSNDHLRQELPLLVEMRRQNILDTSRVVSQRIPLDADGINRRLDDLENHSVNGRTNVNRPKITRPRFPPGCVDKPVSLLTWEWAAAQLTESKHHGLCSVRPNGRPHVVPRWSVHLDGNIYHDGSPETRHARNLEKNPHVSLHLGSGGEVIILEGTAAPAGKPSPEYGRKLSQACKKYKEMGQAPKPDSWDEGGLFIFTPRQCIAWSDFTKDPTKFVF
jgi:hypothetical protein